MSNSWFQFKRFLIRQSDCAMKVGTDGVLLGSWTALPGPGGRILDVGTGTGLLALMLAQRTASVGGETGNDAKIDALEIDPKAAGQAAENFRESPWAERIRMIPSSFQDHVAATSGRYDLIVCNPPYFNASQKTPNDSRNLARHDDSLPLDVLVTGSARLLAPGGILGLVLPADRESHIRALLGEHSLQCIRLSLVVPAPGKPVRRILLECTPADGNSGTRTCREDMLVIETGIRHRYTPEFIALGDDFYLNAR